MSGEGRKSGRDLSPRTKKRGEAPEGVDREEWGKRVVETQVGVGRGKLRRQMGKADEERGRENKKLKTSKSQVQWSKRPRQCVDWDSGQGDVCN